ncbi:unnamed protein product, partial [Rotaria sp. Silwood1]
MDIPAKGGCVGPELEE